MSFLLLKLSDDFKMATGEEQVNCVLELGKIEVGNNCDKEIYCS